MSVIEITSATGTASSLLLSNIRLDGGTQPRSEIDMVTVQEYSDAMKEGAEFPPVIVFYDGDSYWLADGFHRCGGAVKAGLATIMAEVRNGTREEAQWFSIGANQSHGLKRTNKDKRRAVELALEHPKSRGLSLRQIAEHCGVSEFLAHDAKRQLLESNTCDAKSAKPLPESTLGRDGKHYPARRRYVCSGCGYGAERGKHICMNRVSTAALAALQTTEIIDDKSQLGQLQRLGPEQQEEAVSLLVNGVARNVLDARRQMAHAGKRETSLSAAISGRFSVIYADPPWRYSNNGFNTGSPENHYPTMTTDDICSLPVSEMVTENAVLFLWTSNAHLEDALRVMKAWGFEYKTNAVWVKERGTYLGFYLEGFHELLLLGVRGSMQPAIRPRSLIIAPRGEHSQKPKEAADMIETMYPGFKYLEIFCRQSPRNENWTGWGNEPTH